MFGFVSVWPRASNSSSHVGGMSGHTPKSPVVLGRACWWLSLVWLGAGAFCGCAPGAGAFRWPVGLGFLFRYLLRGRRPEDRFFRRYPNPCSGNWVPCIRSTAPAGPSVVFGVTDQMVGDHRLPLGDNTGGARSRTPSANHRFPVPPTGPERRDVSLTVLGFRFALPETLRRHFLRAVAAAAFFVLVGFVSRHKPAEHRIPDVSASPDVVASCFTSCRGGRVSFCLPHFLSVTFCKLVPWSRRLSSGEAYGTDWRSWTATHLVKTLREGQALQGPSADS